MRTREELEEGLARALATGDLNTAVSVAEDLDSLPPRPLPAPGNAALWYAEHGLPIFPLQPGSKVPWPRTRGVKEATTDAATIRAWWKAHPDSNIGLATGHGIDVIDFDGPEAHASWGRAAPDPTSYGVRVLATVSTPRPGGLHVYCPSNGSGNRANVVPHVDYRGLGGYVVAPPSHTSQGVYAFVRPLNPEDLLCRS